ncbi:MAG TPA: hypothetical protein DHW71_01295 [Gammaproteobacteria bacterium]|nr:hypothetical protein [Gammaproteobacteria bacterium]MEC8009774.1 hypothetical protein [Pseudomonadota bacterium]HBF10023.1 hypothetical protein [Gammaproteobacteria bacterium]HCK91586.1 hypothetical protein [Gammaproteobacteria bacterium]|tara:strand:+ start:2024 stop:2449 length:426 start_codon:yes stop_codon:yes gene_type:complete
MNRQIDETQLIKVDYALEKICKAYASERISESLFRHQRAALIEVLQYPALPFPELVLNQFAQGLDDDFMQEETPLVNDYNPPVYPEEREFNPVGYYRKEDIIDQEPDPYYQEDPVSSFDRYYWLYLSAFTLAIVLFIYVNE